MMVVVKYKGNWVHIVKFATTVQFSKDTGWFMICMDWEKANRKRQEFKWIPASTHFEKVKEFIGYA
jgi:hypothetical protein